MKNLKFITKLLHNRFLKEDPYGSLHMPIYDNVAFEYKTAEELAADARVREEAGRDFCLWAGWFGGSMTATCGCCGWMKAT